MSELQRLVDQAQNDHAARPAAAADLLERALALLPGEPGDAQAAARALEHVLLGHLDDAPRLQRALERLQPLAAADAGLAAVLARARVAIALVDGLEPARDAALAPAERVRALYNAALARSCRGDWPAVHARMEAAHTLAQQAGDNATGRAYAAMMNNLATDLGADLTPAQRGSEAARTMLEAAHRAREAWARVGGWMETERADYRLALCHAAVGDSAPALEAARACLARCEAEGADALERLFAHEALLHAQASAGDNAAAEAERAHIRALLAQVDDAESRAFAEGYLASLPVMQGPAG